MKELVELREEMNIVLPYTQSLWQDHNRHFPYTTYGFVMCLFSKIDLFSHYWFPSEKDQTRRMVSFLKRYLDYPEKQSEIAVQVWRHKLMHTSEPRPLTEEGTGKLYKWLLQLDLDAQHHWRFQGGDPEILNVGLFNLVKDLQEGLSKAIEALPQRLDVVNSWEKVAAGLGTFKTKY